MWKMKPSTTLAAVSDGLKTYLQIISTTMPRPTRNAEISPEIARENAKVVGYHFDTNVRACVDAHAPGLRCTTCTPGYAPPPYETVFFGAKREYVDDNDGWTTVHYKSKGRKARKWRGAD